jgi:hypothetical protein
MPRLSNRLIKRQVAAIAAAKLPGFYPDGLGLYLHVSKRGSVSWILMYRIKPLRRKMGLGPLRLVSLAEAREKRDEAHKLLMAGQDPLAHRATRRAKRAASVTFREAARACIEATESKLTNEKSREQWRSTMLGETRGGEKAETDYCAAIANMPVGDIDTAAVLRVLKPIWETKNVTAQRIRERIEKIEAQRAWKAVFVDSAADSSHARSVT